MTDTDDILALELFAAAQLRPGNSFNVALRTIKETVRQIRTAPRVDALGRPTIAALCDALHQPRTAADDASLHDYAISLARNVKSPRELRERRRSDEQFDADHERRDGWAVGE